MDVVNLAQTFDSFDDFWSPRIAAEVNDQAVKLVTVEGEFVWHHHDDADELFYVVSGALRIDFKDEPSVELRPGELVVVPRGVEHRPVADEVTNLLLIEPAETRNTGNVEDERTQRDVERIE